MKELSIEEKAKAYDEAIKRLEDIKNGKCQKTFVFTEGLFDYIFPELKEGDGEKWIPKEIAKYLKEKGDFRSCWLAWLEKQCEQKIKTPEESLGIDSDTYNKIVDECIYGEQKTTDNVEPKFHKGEWIIHLGTENIYQVVARIDNQYQLKYGDNYTIQKCAVVDICARLWDIAKDAKDGDVLFTSSTASHETFIFKNIDEKGNAKCYFAYDSEDGFREGKYHFIGRATKCKPATKEQRDLLFQKMHEAGYEWDADKKELRKIEQNHAWSEEDESMWAEISELLWEGYKQSVSKFSWDDIRNLVIHKLKSIRPQKQWKPSDEQMEALKQAKTDACGKPYFNALVSLYINLKGY